MPWRGHFWSLSSTECWASDMKKKQTTRFNKFFSIWKLCWGWSAWQEATRLGQLHNSHLLYCMGFALLQNVTLTKALLQVHETKTAVLQTAFCLWFDTNYSFLPYFLPLRQFLNCGIVLCFIFPTLSFLISLLNCAESWNNYDAAESFFQLQKGIEGLNGK